MPAPRPNRQKSKPATTATPEVQQARMRGCLIGMAVGEALAAPFVGRKLRAPMFPERTVAESIEIRGGGPHQLRTGQVGWMTQQATALAGQLRAWRRFDLRAAAKAYVSWLPHTPDAPLLTRLALALFEESGWPNTIGKRAWLETGRQFRDAGALARAAPLAVLLPSQRDDRVEAVLADCALTHFAPVCQLASVAWAGLLAAAITTPSEKLTTPEALIALETNISLGATVLARNEPDWVQTIKDAADWLRFDVEAGQRSDPELYGPELHLFFRPDSIRECFRLAMWQFFHPASFEATLVDVVYRGGAADLHGTIAGATAGALWGEQHIPADWRAAVMEGPPGLPQPLATTYHPTTLAILAGTEYDPKATEPQRPVWD